MDQKWSKWYNLGNMKQEEGQWKRWTQNNTKHAKIGEFVATRKREVRQYVGLFVFVVIPYCWKLLWSNLKYTLSLSNPDPSLLANKTTCSNSLTFFNYSSNLLSVFSHLPCTLIQFAYPTVPTLKFGSESSLRWVTHRTQRQHPKHSLFLSLDVCSKQCQTTY